jgi:hypothetical protein
MMMLIAVVVSIVIILALLAIAEHFWPATLFLVLSLGWLWYQAQLSLLWHLWHWYYLAPYFLIGLGWLWFKWDRLIANELSSWLKYHKAETVIEHTPQWSQHSYDLAPHFFYWPLSMVAYVLHDLMFDVWEWISNAVSGAFNRYAEQKVKRFVQRKELK